MPHSRQRVREPRHRRSREAAAVGDFEIAEPRLVALEASQHIECARYHLDDITLASISRERSLPTQPLRTSSHGPYQLLFVVPLYGIKFRSENTLPQASCDDNKKAIGVPEIKIVAKVAGRICIFPVEVGKASRAVTRLHSSNDEDGVPVLSPRIIHVASRQARRCRRRRPDDRDASQADDSVDVTKAAICSNRATKSFVESLRHHEVDNDRPSG